MSRSRNHNSLAAAVGRAVLSAPPLFTLQVGRAVLSAQPLLTLQVGRAVFSAPPLLTLQVGRAVLSAPRLFGMFQHWPIFVNFIGALRTVRPTCRSLAI